MEYRTVVVFALFRWFLHGKSCFHKNTDTSFLVVGCPVWIIVWFVSSQCIWLGCIIAIIVQLFLSVLRAANVNMAISVKWQHVLEISKYPKFLLLLSFTVREAKRLYDKEVPTVMNMWAWHNFLIVYFSFIKYYFFVM